MHIYGNLSISGLESRQRVFRGNSVQITFNEPTKLEYLLRWKAKAITYSHYKELFNIEKIEEQLYDEVEKASYMLNKEAFKNNIYSYIYQLHVNKLYLILAPTVLTYITSEGIPHLDIGDTIIVDGMNLPLTQYERGILYSMAWLYTGVWDRLSTIIHELIALAKNGKNGIQLLLTTMQSELQSQYVHENDITEKARILYRVALVNYIGEELTKISDLMKNASQKMKSLSEFQSKWTQLISNMRNELTKIIRHAALLGKLGAGSDIEWYNANVITERVDINGAKVEVVNLLNYTVNDQQSRVKFHLGPSAETVHASLLAYALTSINYSDLESLFEGTDAKKQYENVVQVIKRVFGLIATLALTARDCNNSIQLSLEAMSSYRTEEGIESAAKVLTALIDTANMISELGRSTNIRPIIQANVLYTNMMPNKVILRNEVAQVTYPFIMTIRAEHGLRVVYSIPGLIGLSKQGELESTVSTDTVLVVNKEILSPNELALPVEVHEIPGSVVEVSIRSLEILPGLPDYLREYKVQLPKVIAEEFNKIRLQLSEIFESYRHQVDIRALSDLLNAYLELSRIIIRRLNTDNNGIIKGVAIISTILLGVASQKQSIRGAEKSIYSSDKILGILTLNLIANRYKNQLTNPPNILNLDPDTTTIKVAIYDENHGEVILSDEAKPVKEANRRSDTPESYFNYIPNLPDGPKKLYLDAIAADTNPEEVRQLLESLHMNIEGVMGDIAKKSKFKLEALTTDLGTVLYPVEQMISNILQSIRSTGRYNAAISSIVNDYMSMIDKTAEIVLDTESTITKIIGLYTDGRGGGVHDHLELRLAPAFRFAIGTARKLENMSLRIQLASECAGVLIDRTSVDMNRVPYTIAPINPVRIPIKQGIVEQVSFPGAVCLAIDAKNNMVKPEEVQDYYRRITSVGGQGKPTNQGSASTTTQQQQQGSAASETGTGTSGANTNAQ